MPSIPSARRPGTETTLGDHEKRIRNLERHITIPPHEFIYARARIASQTFTNTSGSAAIADSKIPLTLVDANGVDTSALADGKFVCPTAGFYQVNADGLVVKVNGKNAQVVVDTGTEAVFWSSGLMVASGFDLVTMTISQLFHVAAGGYLQWRIYVSTEDHAITIDQAADTANDKPADFSIYRVD